MRQADRLGTAQGVLVDVHQRLAREFAETLEPEAVLACVAKAQRELDIVPVAALPELLERLARVRLRGKLERLARVRLAPHTDLAAIG